MARRPPSTRSFSMDHHDSSRRTSVDTSNPNVFSDDYAVDPAESLSLRDSIDSRSERLSVHHDRGDFDAPREFVPPGLPGNSFGHSRLSSSKRAFAADASADPHRSISSSRSIADTRRTLSTSTNFSIPRAQSPYRGPTAPSQPYALYPQATRASSIASESTIRPLDRLFIPQGGPEHPYSMYPQNTVPEEGDDSTPHIALGFPGLSQSFQQGTSSSGDDVGDIVGRDGHIEQLPPYSRYADNVIAKGDMGTIEPQAASIVSDESALGPTMPPTSSRSDVELTAVLSGPSSEEVARKEGLTEQNKRRRTCFGVPIWAIVALVVVVVLAAVLGGVVGGVVGNEKGTDRALSATTTVWLDADPAQTGPSTPSCPTGHYNIPLNQTQQINSCIVDSRYSLTWGCMNYANLGINVFESQNGGPPLSVAFDDYSVRPQLFRYGPQPPDFNGTAFTLQPFKDKDDDNLGVALFFSVLFDKLSILPWNALALPPHSKRSVPELVERDDGNDNEDGGDPHYLSVGDKPWFCFWNSTISEFWVFLDQNMNDGSSSSSTPATITSGSSATPPPNPSGTSPTAPMHATQSPTASAMTTSSPSEPTQGPYWSSANVKRQSSGIGSPNFPKLAKMVEKRKPAQNVKPYCQQMQVLNDWQIMPIPDIPIIHVTESEYGAAAATGGSRHKRSPDTVQQLGSNCICEWYSA